MNYTFLPIYPYSPAKNNQPDYDKMERLISAIQNLAIKDVVIYSDRKIKATKSIIG